MKKPFKVKMINRRSIKIIGYASYGVRIEYCDTREQCTVHESVIREFIPKKRVKKKQLKLKTSVLSFNFNQKNK